MEKLILVFYVFVGNSSGEEAHEFMNKTIDMVKPDLDENGITAYFIPVKEGHSRVECINPKLITGEEYQQIIKVLDDAKLKMDEFLKESSKN